jgi:cyclopropane fatty-acyl-phospholipid synthase-like methyltransferase
MLPGMDGEDLEEALYARMHWNTPLSQEHAGLLMDRLDLRPGVRIADLGCGWGELLLQALALASTTDGTAAGGTATGATACGTPGQATGIGVDTDAAALDRARHLARERHLDHRVQFTDASAADWRGPADRVLCVGAAHAFGGTGPALAALAQVVPPGGRLLFGDGYWEGVPSAEALEIFGEQLLRLPQVLDECRAAGWRVIHLSTADQREWDDFESTFRAGRQEWLLDHGGDSRAAEVRDWLDTREREYAEVYRQILGFVYLILAH